MDEIEILVGKIKSAIARYPLAVFLGIFVVELGVVALLALTARSDFAAAAWSQRAARLNLAVAGLAALLCCWALSTPAPPGVRWPARLGMTAGVAVALTVLSIATTWYSFRALPGGPMPLGGVLRLGVGDIIWWLEAVVIGLVVSGVVSLSAVVRRLTRALFVWRAPGVSLLTVAAVGVPASLALAANVGVQLVHISGHTPLTFGGSAVGAAISFLWALLSLPPFVFAWYGFAAERVTRRVPPLVTGLMVGAASVLPHMLVSLANAARLHFSVGLEDNLLLNLSYAAAVAIVAVWLTERARSSLLPALVFMASVAMFTRRRPKGARPSRSW